MIKYVKYDTLEKRPIILKHLQDYNISFTGERPLEDRYFYVIEDKMLRGLIYTHLGWDWVTFSHVFYEDIEILQLLLSKICVYFQGKAVGITFESDDISTINDLYQIGFTNEGKINRTPKINERHITTHTTFHILSDSLFDVEETIQLNDSIDNELKERLSQKAKKKKTDLIYIATDNDNFVGGVHGEIIEDTMYVSLLVVQEAYKGQKIGTKLMDLIENMAFSKGVLSVDLGTCDFQAKPFYLKRGYNVVSTLIDYPKGFNEYTLVKILNSDNV
jgi:ribosomal protein S18 acetylase RimI-like enzyme